MLFCLMIVLAMYFDTCPRHFGWLALAYRDIVLLLRRCACRCCFCIRFTVLRWFSSTPPPHLLVQVAAPTAAIFFGCFLGESCCSRCVFLRRLSITTGGRTVDSPRWFVQAGFSRGTGLGTWCCILVLALHEQAYADGGWTPAGLRESRAVESTRVYSVVFWRCSTHYFYAFLNFFGQHVHVVCPLPFACVPLLTAAAPPHVTGSGWYVRNFSTGDLPV